MNSFLIISPNTYYSYSLLSRMTVVCGFFHGDIVIDINICVITQYIIYECQIQRIAVHKIIN